VFNGLFIVCLAPLLGFVILGFGRKRLSENAAAIIGVGTVGVSALMTLGLAIQFCTRPPPDGVFTQPLWQWFQVANFAPRFALRLDGLSLTMMGVVTGVGFFIHLFASWYMRGDESYARFFSYMNLFIASMLFLVLGDNLLFLYFGWEGVGLCSYLLIGFWYQDPANGAAARKAFVVTRVGDAFMAIGLIWLYRDLGTLDIQQLILRAPHHFAVGDPAITVITLLLLGGAVGKSAQLPLQTWLPDAMAGPTPVSALIHAATMVTAGVYLIARTHVLFALSPGVLTAVAGLGCATLLIAAFAALNQHDIKRILAYSTISQIGYMFLALGVGAWSAAIFPFMVHAFFKALLFLSAGAITMRLHHEHDIFRMGGLAKRLPAAFWSFLIGSASLAALPLVTAGFYSKEMILSATWAGGGRIPVLWAGGVLTAFVTALYIFRAVFIVFFGPAQPEITGRYGWRILLPLTLLSGLALVGGCVETPSGLGGIPLFGRFMASVFGPTPIATGGAELLRLGLASFISLLGIGLAYLLYQRPAPHFAAWAQSQTVSAVRGFLFSGWGFDRLYHTLIVRPFLAIVHGNRQDALDTPFLGIALLCRWLHQKLHATQTGRIRWYAGFLAAGSAVTIAIAVLR